VDPNGLKLLAKYAKILKSKDPRRVMKSWREINLIDGVLYKLTQDISSPVGDFACGEIVRFEDSSYSRYDCATIFVFTNSSGETKQFFLHDETEWPKGAFEQVS
jgi:hypothetical protein